MGRYEAAGTGRQLISLDALNRAVRTWWAVVGAGLLVTIGDLGMHLILTGDIFSLDAWAALLRGVITALLAAVFSYLARFKAPPPAAPQTTTLTDDAAAGISVGKLGIHQLTKE